MTHPCECGREPKRLFGFGTAKTEAAPSSSTGLPAPGGIGLTSAFNLADCDPADNSKIQGSDDVRLDQATLTIAFWLPLSEAIHQAIGNPAQQPEVILLSRFAVGPLRKSNAKSYHASAQSSRHQVGAAGRQGRTWPWRKRTRSLPERYPSYTSG
ncbi:hypothetical protein SF83666_c20150 [Sinorhizobium fredii CCBAU 83666]|nr:hypothetical protein SF83666_c20150 [Sinorhizobium fredii CCBAU 83666]